RADHAIALRRAADLRLLRLDDLRRAAAGRRARAGEVRRQTLRRVRARRVPARLADVSLPAVTARPAEVRAQAAGSLARQIVLWAPPVLYAAAIFLFSAMPRPPRVPGGLSDKSSHGLERKSLDQGKIVHPDATDIYMIKYTKVDHC